MNGILVNDKQLGQVPDLSQACELIKYTLSIWCSRGVVKVLGKKNDSSVLFGLVNKWLDRSSMTTEYDSKWPDIDLFSDASFFFLLVSCYA